MFGFGFRIRSEKGTKVADSIVGFFFPSVMAADVDGTYAIPGDVRGALEAIFGHGSTQDVMVIYRPGFVRRHLIFVGGRYGSVTRPGKIYMNLPEEEFFEADAHVLHEFYHVIEQWGRQGMTVPGYLLRARQREREANEFAEQNLKRYRDALKLGTRPLQ